MKISKIIFFGIVCLLLPCGSAYGKNNQGLGGGSSDDLSLNASPAGSNGSGSASPSDDFISMSPSGSGTSKKHHKGLAGTSSSNADSGTAGTSSGNADSVISDEIVAATPGATGTGTSAATNSNTKAIKKHSGKLKMLEQQVAKLQADVKSLKQSVAALQSSAS